MREWPGIAGPLVHVGGWRSPSADIAQALGAKFGPAYRVFSIELRRQQPYQVHAVDLIGAVEQFGFVAPVLVGEHLGCLAALLVAAWFPRRVSKLVLIDPIESVPLADDSGIQARALSDCPPDWPALRSSVGCPVLDLQWGETALEHLRAFLQLP